MIKWKNANKLCIEKAGSVEGRGNKEAEMPIPATEFAGEVPRKRNADAVIGCRGWNVGGKRLKSRIRSVDRFEPGTMLVWPVRFDDLPCVQHNEAQANQDAAARAFNWVAFEGTAVGQASQGANTTGPTSAGGYGPQRTGGVFFRDDAEDKRIENVKTALPLVAAIPQDNAGMVGQAADVVAYFSILHGCIQRSADETSKPRLTVPA